MWSQPAQFPFHPEPALAPFGSMGGYDNYGPPAPHLHTIPDYQIASNAARLAQQSSGPSRSLSLSGPPVYAGTRALQHGSAGLNRELSSPTYTPGNAAAECNDECAEEECNPDICGDENRPPSKASRGSFSACGVECRYLLPVALACSTLAAGLFAVLLSAPRLRALARPCSWTFVELPTAMLYAVTLLCLLYCAIGDPGQLREGSWTAGEGYVGVDGDSEADSERQALPRRCKRTWLYRLPLRRYSHYCRWLCNCVGLLNHREYVTMCAGIVLVGASGGAVDMYLFINSLLGKLDDAPLHIQVLLALHFVYCMVLLTLAFPIFRIHVGLVARNELAAEWKRNEHDIVVINGQSVPVNDLDEDTFNDRFDTFVYDSARNPYDNGCLSNCCAFWCTARYRPEQLGEF